MLRRNAILSLAAGLLFAAAAPFGPDAPDVPPTIAAPPGHRPLLEVSAKGVQIYKAVEAAGGKLAWTLEAPLADLYDDQLRPIGRHYEGPSWEAPDGSALARDESEPVRSADAPDPRKDIPWLLVKVKPKGPEAGAFAGATYIQRLRTSGGKAPSVLPKRAGTKVGVPYTASYLLLGKA